MAPNAVVLLILSQLFLLSHASVDPSAVSRWDPQQPQEEKRDAMIQEQQQQQQDGPSPKETGSVVAFDPRPAHLPADADLSRMIAHSLRFPTGRHGAHHLRHRHASLRPTVELSYGNDMVGVPIEEKKKINKMEKKNKHHDDDDGDDDDDDDWTEHKMRKKMMMKKRFKKKMMLKKFKRDRKRESRGGFVNWISSILNRF